MAVLRFPDAAVCFLVGARNIGSGRVGTKAARVLRSGVHVMELLS